MPVVPTYPGVYIEEIPSGVRTITGVATSITAFVGFALRGPTNEPVRIQNFGDFERQFGGLNLDSTMSYAVRQFFDNGGSDAIIVRLSNEGVRAIGDLGNELVLEAVMPGDEELTATVNYDNIPPEDEESFNLVISKDDENIGTLENVKSSGIDEAISSNADLSPVIRLQPGKKPTVRTAEGAVQIEGGRDPGSSASIQLPIYERANGEIVMEEGSPKVDKILTLVAVSEGKWGNQLQAIVDHDVPDVPGKDKMFNLTVQSVGKDDITGEDTVTASETLRNLSVDQTSKRYLLDVINAESNFVRVAGAVPSKRSEENSVDEDGNPIPVKSDGKGGNGDPPLDYGFYIGDESSKTGLYALEKADLFNLLCIPPVNRQSNIVGEGTTVLSTALKYCVKRRAMLLVDAPSTWQDTADAEAGVDSLRKELGAKFATNTVVYFPRLKMADPLKEYRIEEFVPCGAVAGIIARTDVQRGVWKAPAGIDATFSGVREFTYKMTNDENGRLNPKGLNCLRVFPVYGNVIWGARTLAGDDRLASEWKYLPVRRTVLFLEESLYRGTQWVVFEPNDEPLWAQIRLNIGVFMNDLFRQGAFQGSKPSDAYFVKCDKETTTQSDINRGIVNIIVGFAPLKPAEFVIIKFQQIAGQLAT